MLDIRSLKLYDADFGTQWRNETENHWGYDDYKADPKWRKEWISFDCCLYSRADDRVYVGITSFDSDIFKAYDRAAGRFVDLGYDRVANPFDAKFHRSLAQASDGRIYAAIALLHDVDRFLEAPGGAIVRYDPATEEIEKLAVPVPHVYIQSMVLDEARQRLYCLCFAPEKLASYDLRTGRVCDYGLICSGITGMAQGENLCLDDEGGVWTNWALTRAWQSEAGPDAVKLCKIDPEADRIVFHQAGLPRPDGSYGTTRSEGLFNFHTGCLYASGANGSLFRVDPKTGEAEHLFTPIADRPSRLASMTLAPDGLAYGTVGKEGRCELMRFDPARETYELLGEIRDQDGTYCWQVHDLVATDDGMLYCGENDVPHRSGYLWQCRIP